MSAPVCSVVIVNFNGAATVPACVESVLDSTIPVEVILGDNGSTDGSLESLLEWERNEPRLRVLENGANLGFAAAANLALPFARASWLLFLNPDTVLRADTLERMFEAVGNRPEVGMAGPLILGADGLEQAGCRRREPTPARALRRMLEPLRAVLPGVAARPDGYEMHREPLPVAPVAVEAVSGAFMLVRREALERVGPMDPGFFLHCEDLDWCRRFRDSGYTVLFVPGVSILHYQGGSSRTRRVRVEWHKHRGMLRYYRKHFAGDYPRPMFWLVGAAVWLRFTGLAVVLALRGLRTARVRSAGRAV